MATFNEIIDIYLTNYSTYDYSKIVFECEHGELIFYKDKNNLNSIIIYGIFIKEEHRQKGLCKNILQYCIDNGNKYFKTLIVESVLSKILYDYLLRFNYNNKGFKLTQKGFIYNF
jgi:hypothetical protein